MSIQNFIPTIWNASLLTEFHEQAIAAGLANRSYEGDATRGNTVKINTAGAITIKDYKAAGRTTEPEDVSTTDQDLLIDQEKVFDFLVDDIDRVQAAGSLDVYTSEAAIGLVDDADKFLLARAATQAGITQTGPAPVDAEDAWDILRDLRKALRKNKVPNAARVAIVNAEFEALLLGYDSKMTKANESATTAGLRSAALGNILGFDVYTSENLPETDEPQVVAFWRPALAYVSQVTETEAMRAEKKFADRLRGLHVYGGKVIRPEAVATWSVEAGGGA